jgi:hypothetical protein
MADAKCDWRVNFRGMWGHVGIRAQTVLTSDVLGGLVFRTGEKEAHTRQLALSCTSRPDSPRSTTQWAAALSPSRPCAS